MDKIKAVNRNYDKKAYLGKAKVWSKLKKVDQALECYDKVIVLDFFDRESYIRKADYLRELRRFDEAQECLKSSILSIV